jgi:polyisoprenoid-binding protein YceI
MRTRLAAGLVVVVIFAAFPAAAQEFKIDPSHSSANFTVRHMLVSNVNGRFAKMSGGLYYDEKAPEKSWVKAVIDATSVNTDRPDRDNHLRSADFFEVEKHPQITFESQRVEKRGDGFVAFGTLTMKGVAKEIELPFEFLGKVKDPRGKTRVGFEATTVLNRKDYGINWSRMMDTGGAVVSDNVKINLQIEAVEAPPSPAERSS